MLCETRPSYARVLHVTAGAKAIVPEDRVFDEKAVTVPALKPKWLQRNLTEMAIGKEFVRIFPDVRSARSTQQNGYSVEEYIELVYGEGPEAGTWEGCAHNLEGLGFTTGTDESGKTTLDIVLSSWSTRKRKSAQVATSGDSEPPKRECSRRETASDRAFAASLMHWPRCLDTGTFFTLNPEKHCSQSLKAREWNMRICELAYRTCVRMVCNASGDDPFVQTMTSADYRRKLQRLVTLWATMHNNSACSGSEMCYVVYAELSTQRLGIPPPPKARELSFCRRQRIGISHMDGTSRMELRLHHFHAPTCMCECHCQTFPALIVMPFLLHAQTDTCLPPPSRIACRDIMAMATTMSMVQGMKPLALPSPSTSPNDTAASVALLTYPHPHPPLTSQVPSGHPHNELAMEDLPWLGADDACDDNPDHPDRDEFSLDDVFATHEQGDTRQPKTASIRKLSDGGSNHLPAPRRPPATVGEDGKKRERNKTADVSSLHNKDTTRTPRNTKGKMPSRYNP